MLDIRGKGCQESKASRLRQQIQLTISRVFIHVLKSDILIFFLFFQTRNTSICSNLAASSSGVQLSANFADFADFQAANANGNFADFSSHSTSGQFFIAILIKFQVKLYWIAFATFFFQTLFFISTKHDEILCEICFAVLCRRYDIFAECNGDFAEFSDFQAAAELSTRTTAARLITLVCLTISHLDLTMLNVSKFFYQIYW